MRIGFACIITVFVETLFFYLLGLKDKLSLVIVVLVNIITNLLLNLIIHYGFHGNPGNWVYLLESIIVLIEYLIFSFSKLRQNKRKLFVLTLLANLLSYILGVVLQIIF